MSNSGSPKQRYKWYAIVGNTKQPRATFAAAKKTICLQLKPFLLLAQKTYPEDVKDLAELIKHISDLQEIGGSEEVWTFKIGPTVGRVAIQNELI